MHDSRRFALNSFPLKIGLASLLLFSGLKCAAAQQDRDWDACRGADIEIRIASCTSVINRGDRESPAKRAIAYNNRGVSYNSKDDYDRAIQDFNDSIQLDPKIGAAYNNRGFAYSKKGDLDRAIRDYDASIRV